MEWNSSTVNISLPTLCSQEKIPLQSSAAAKLKTLKNAKRKLKKKQMKLKEILEEDVETLEFPDITIYTELWLLGNWRIQTTAIMIMDAVMSEYMTMNQMI